MTVERIKRLVIVDYMGREQTKKMRDLELV